MDYNKNVTEIQTDLLDTMPSVYSKIKGCWLWEIMKAFAIKFSELLSQLTDTSNKLNIENLQGDELDAYVSQWTDLTRKVAQRASGYIQATGRGTIYSGTLVANDSVQYEVVADVVVNGTAEVPIVAVEEGEIGNCGIGCVTKMITSNANITSITNTSAIEGGTDEETDDALRSRYYIRLSMPVTSGNKSHYILWAMECTGVGGAKATRDALVKNKVNVYICGDNGILADSKTVQSVQTYIDPSISGDGSGVAPIGAICQVYSAGLKKLVIEGKVEMDNTLEWADIIDVIKKAIEQYLAEINFHKTEVSYARLLNIALNCEGVNDITDFKVNNGYVNIVCSETEIFTLEDLDLEVE